MQSIFGCKRICDSFDRRFRLSHLSVIFAQSKTWRKEYKHHGLRIRVYDPRDFFDWSTIIAWMLVLMAAIVVVLPYDYRVQLLCYLYSCAKMAAPTFCGCECVRACVCGRQYGNWADNKTWSGPSTLKLIWTALLCESRISMVFAFTAIHFHI